MDDVRFNPVGADPESDAGDSLPNPWLARLRRLGIIVLVLLVAFLLLPPPWRWRIQQTILPPRPDTWEIPEYERVRTVHHADGSIEFDRRITCSAGEPATFEISLRQEQRPIPEGSETFLETSPPGVRFQLRPVDSEPPKSAFIGLVDSSSSVQLASVPSRRQIIGSPAVARLRISHSSQGTLTIIDELARENAVIYRGKIEPPAAKHRCEVIDSPPAAGSWCSLAIGMEIMRVSFVVDATPGTAGELVEYSVHIVGIEAGQ